MRSLPRSVLPLLYSKANAHPWRLLCRKPGLSWPSSVVIESDSGKLMPGIEPRMINYGKGLNHRRSGLPRYEKGSAIHQSFWTTCSFLSFFSYLDVIVAISILLHWRRRIMPSVLLSTTHRRKRSRPRTWQTMPALVLIVFLVSAFMLIVLTKPYQFWTPWLTLTLR